MNQDTIKSSQYHHLSKADRDVISYGLAQGKSDTEIALELNRDRSTIYRERKRNIPSIRDVRYLSHRAQMRAEIRSIQSHMKPRLKDQKTKNYVVKQLKEGLSPQQIAGRMKEQKMDISTNHESIYQFIYEEARDLIKYLRKHHRKRRNRGSGQNKRVVRVPNRVMINERPKKANLRNEYGHWEADTITSRRSLAAVQVLLERKTRFVKITKLKAKTSSYMSIAMNRRLCKVPGKMRKTMTYDNGTENVDHERSNKVLNMKSYFCNPYHSWEKGGVENINGLIREYLPKGCDLSKITKEEARAIEKKLNNRPRKCLGYQTPAEVFGRCCA